MESSCAEQNSALAKGKGGHLWYVCICQSNQFLTSSNQSPQLYESSAAWAAKFINHNVFEFCYFKVDYSILFSLVSGFSILI